MEESPTAMHSVGDGHETADSPIVIPEVRLPNRCASESHRSGPGLKAEHPMMAIAARPRASQHDHVTLGFAEPMEVHTGQRARAAQLAQGEDGRNDDRDDAGHGDGAAGKLSASQ